MKIYYETNKERFAERKRAWEKANPEKIKAYKRAYYKANKEKIDAYKRSYYAANEEKIRAYQEANKEKRKVWCKNNRAKLNAKAVRHQAQMLKATPPWLSSKMKEEILAKYQEAQILSESTGIPHHVDHIIPLQGKTVRGLHVPWNLQVIPAIENLKKSNRLL